jgi:replicative DNA helicase
MDNDERLSGTLQENILSVLCFDDKFCKLVCATVSPKLFESTVFREVAGHAMDYIEQYGEPIKEHLPDHLESILMGDDARKASTYKRLLDNLFLSKDGVNGAYVVQQLHKFVRQQNIKSGLAEAIEAVNDGRIDDAELAMQKSLNTQAVAFEPGLRLDNVDDLGAILDDPEEEGFDMGIPMLDERGIIPRRKELYMLMAPRGKGKSWFLTHCAKQALKSRWSVLIVTLEMSERRYAARMLQSLFSISRREGSVLVTRFSKDRDGDLQSFIEEKIERPSMKDEDIRAFLMRKAKSQFMKRKRLVIKAFSTKRLTIPMLNAYLDGLQRFENFTPDAVIIDYPDLFAMDAKAQKRDEVGRIVEELRGIGNDRNAAMITVTQGNRESEKATTVTGDMVAEDISKLATADVLLTLSQTAAEYALGLARLFVEKVRNEEGKMTALITQAYAIGQFCLDSVRLSIDYWEMMKDRGERNGRRRKRSDDDEEE